MNIHDHVLRTALRLCRGRRNWRFRPAEVVAELPGLNSGSVRTHVMSRCCVNAPAHHSHRWPYFRRVERGVYEILPAMRTRKRNENTSPRGERHVRYGARDAPRARPEAPVAVRESGGGYLARIPGRPRELHAATIDGLLSRVRRSGHSGAIRLCITLEVEPPNAVVAAYEREVDRTQIRKNLRATPEERLLELQRWIEAMDHLRGAATPVRRPLE